MKLLLALASAVLACSAQLKHLPDYYQRLACRKSDPEFERCVADAFPKVVEGLLEGVPEFGIPPIDPFALDVFRFERTVNDDTKFSGELRNVEAHGASGVLLDGYRTDGSRLKPEHKIRFPRLNVTFDYSVGGVVFGMPFNSEGRVYGDFDNLRVYTKVALAEIERDGVRVLMVERIKPRLKLGDGYIKVTTVDPSLQATADTMAYYFNNNPAEAVETMQRFYDAYSDDTMIKDLINRELTLVPESEILPD